MSDQNDRPHGSTRRAVLRASALSGAGLALGGLTPFANLAFGATGPNDTTPSFTPTDIFFNAHHSPIGAYATFTLGYPGANGGFGQQQKLPGKQSTYVGIVQDGAITALPFFDPSISPSVGAYAQDAVTRDFRVASDTFATTDFSFTLFSPVRSIPNPTGVPAGSQHGSLTGKSTSGSHPIEDVLLPAIFAELVIDNTSGTSAKTGFFAVSGGSAAVLDQSNPAVSFGTGSEQTAIATGDAGAIPFAATDLATGLAGTGTGGAVGGISVHVPAGKSATVRFAICFFAGGNVTNAVRPTSFWYTRYYASIGAVITAALTGLPSRVASFAKDNLLVDNATITPDQKFLLSQSIHSYYGNTAFLQDTTGAPWWIVMEGQYQYMNTFDLTVDHVFFEIGMNPWTVRNVLENSYNFYSYQTGVETQGNADAPGGIDFTHDMGQWPNFSPDGTSAYERPNVFGTFSYQAGEELVNWVLIAGVYINQTNDLKWYKQYIPVLQATFDSIANRDNPNTAQRDGIESFNASVVGTGEEITTYDSVGPGLTEAVGNTYLGGKEWAAYVILEFLLLGAPDIVRSVGAFSQASKAAATITAAMQPAGFIASNVYNGEAIPIIPVVEGLVYPYFAGRQDAVSPHGLYGDYIKALNRHLTTVLSTQYCIFPNGGWNLDSQSLNQNTWLSKIFLNEFVGRQVLGQSIRPVTNAADAQSVVWLTQTAGALTAFGDQVINQVPGGSLYYPRGVTSIVWLQEPPVS